MILNHDDSYWPGPTEYEEVKFDRWDAIGGHVYFDGKLIGTCEPYSVHFSIDSAGYINQYLDIKPRSLTFSSGSTATFDWSGFEYNPWPGLSGYEINWKDINITFAKVSNIVSKHIKELTKTFKPLIDSIAQSSPPTWPPTFKGALESKKLKHNHGPRSKFQYNRRGNKNF